MNRWEQIRAMHIERVRAGRVPLLILKPGVTGNAPKRLAGAAPRSAANPPSERPFASITERTPGAAPKSAANPLSAHPVAPITERNPDPAPGLLWIHGGGYFLGMKEMALFSRAAALVGKYGVTVVSPGYRLSWQKPYPAAVEDCYEALVYLYEHAEQWGIDPHKIMVGGESAGGGLAAAVCMMARDRGTVPVRFQFPLYPMLSNIDTESSKDNHGKVWDTRRNHLGWLTYLRHDAKKEVSPYASPAWQTDYRGLPPCYTFVGDGEPFYTETLVYVRHLKEAGVSAEVDVYHSDRHAFDLMRPGEEPGRSAIRRFEEYFDYVLKTYLKNGGNNI